MPLFRKEVFEAKRRRLRGEVVLSQPLSYSLLTLLLSALVIGVAIALVFGTYARTEAARGYLRPTEGLAAVHAQRVGTVEAVFVREGAIVEAGDALLRVRSEQIDAAGVGVEARQISLLRERLAVMDQRIEHARSQADLGAQKLGAEIAGLETEIVQTRARLDIQLEITESARESIRGLDELLAKGFVAKSEYERRRQAYLNEVAQETQIRQALSALETRLKRTKQDRAALPQDEAEAVRELMGQRGDLERELVGLEGQRAYTSTAPIRGRIAALHAATGQLADPSRPLLTILPEGASLEAELLVPSRAIGFVAPGQTVRLLYDAFPYQRFGAYEGEVVNVTRTILAPSEVVGPLTADEPVYRIAARPTAQSVIAYGQEVPLQVGMTLTANIVIERRSLLDWLLEPLRAVGART